MERFLSESSVPTAKVTMAAVSDYKPEIITELVNNYKIKVVSPAPIEGIEGSERYHADMGILHLGNKKFILDENNIDLSEKLKEIGAEIMLCKDITASRPALNVCIVGNRVLCNKTRTDAKLLEYFDDNEIRVIHTRQGYAKCSAAVINKNAVITSDMSIYKSCLAEKIDVLKVSCEGIKLDGYDYGFIGGCCGMIDAATLVFSGDIKKHRNYEDIKIFAKNYGVEVASAGKGDLYDIGGIIPILEKGEDYEK